MSLPREQVGGRLTALPAPSDDELLDRIRRGDEAALTALYDRYAGFVTAVAIRILGDRSLAEEVVQDTFLSCWHNVDTYDPSRGRVAAWLIGIARNRAIDLLRSRSNQARRREGTTVSDSLPAEVPEVADIVALRDALTGALAELPADQRHVIELAYYGGMTQAEIAHHLGAPLGTVKTRARSAMEKLRVSLRPYFALDIGDETR